MVALRLMVVMVAAMALASIVTSGCRSTEPADTPKPMNMQRLSGTVTYRQRIALPPDAIVHVNLEDISRADVPPFLVATVDIPAAGRQAPIAFMLEYDAAKIIARHRYALRATITSGNALHFAATQGQAVLTHGAPDRDVQIIVSPARSDASNPSAPSGARLEDTQWRLIEINGAAALPSDRPRQAGIMFVSKDRTIGSNTSINSMGGRYTLQGASLSIEPGMMTMMAGPEPLMQQEQAFIAALKRVTAYRISGDTLELLAGETAIMKFEASVTP